MNTLLGKKAEEILSDDSLFDEFKKNHVSETDAEKTQDLEETLLIYRSLTKPGEKISHAEQNEVGQKISASIIKTKQRRLFTVISTAAAVFIMLFGLYTVSRQTADNLQSFAASVEIEPTSENTRLILNGEKEIQITGKESTIEYATSGEEIQIDSGKKIAQKIGNNTPVFNTIVVPYGKRSQITLSDNSKVWLNSGSKLIYPAQFENEKREVFLEGEAIFEVARNEKQPFFVITSTVEIKVLGTVFNISAYSDDKSTNTVLEKGSVELKYKSSNLLKRAKVKMEPGTLAVYNPELKTLQQSKVDTRNYTCWREGYFILHNETLQNLTKKLSRYYNIPIVIENESLKTKTFSGRLDLKNSAEMVLEIIAETTEFALDTTNNQIKINQM